MATKEVINSSGFIDHILVENETTGELATTEDGTLIAVCPSCECFVYRNEGQGSLCSHCKVDFTEGNRDE